MASAVALACSLLSVGRFSIRKCGLSGTAAGCGFCREKQLSNPVAIVYPSKEARDATIASGMTKGVSASYVQVSVVRPCCSTSTATCSPSWELHPNSNVYVLTTHSVGTIWRYAPPIAISIPVGGAPKVPVFATNLQAGCGVGRYGKRNAIKASLKASSVIFGWPPAAMTRYCRPCIL